MLIQLYNVSATNRLNLPGNSTPQKTITAVEASLSPVITLPFKFYFSIRIETRKVEKYFLRIKGLTVKTGEEKSVRVVKEEWREVFVHFLYAKPHL